MCILASFTYSFSASISPIMQVHFKCCFGFCAEHSKAAHFMLEQRFVSLFVLDVWSYICAIMYHVRGAALLAFLTVYAFDCYKLFLEFILFCRITYRLLFSVRCAKVCRSNIYTLCSLPFFVFVYAFFE